MRVFAGVQRVRLIDAFTQRAILVDAMDGEAARVVESGEQIFAGDIDAGVDRPGGQRQRRTVRRQFTGRSRFLQAARRCATLSRPSGAVTVMIVIPRSPVFVHEPDYDISLSS
jgi:hypothetical protein